MRDIKFRAWDNNEEWMVDDMLLSFDGEILTDDVQPHDTPYKEIELADEGRYELMQYTGMKDVKGIEIYEGDIIREDIEKGGPPIIVSVVWEDCAFYGKERTHNPEYIVKEFLNGKVIGNIYENPELLED